MPAMSDAGRNKPRKPDAAQVRSHVRARTRTLVHVPWIGELLPGPGSHVELPDRPALAYAGTVIGLAALEVIEWPLGAALVAAHLASQRRAKSRALAAVEEAFKDAG
jgi:hypothetical protein